MIFPLYNEEIHLLGRREITDFDDLANKRVDTPERVLLDFAEKVSADLIVIGGYGHSRIREVILGGVTRFMVKHSPVPVLLSH